MSRIGKKPVVIPAGVTVDVAAGNAVTVKGPKGTLSYTFHPDMILKLEGNVLTVERPDEEHLHKSLHGLTRTLLSNMVEGVANGYKKELDVNGVTLVSPNTLDKSFEGATGNAEAAKKVGLLVAERALAKGIEEVVFDRGGYVYHGRVAALAEGAREGGLKF